MNGLSLGGYWIVPHHPEVFFSFSSMRDSWRNFHVLFPTKSKARKPKAHVCWLQKAWRSLGVFKCFWKCVSDTNSTRHYVYICTPNDCFWKTIKLHNIQLFTLKQKCLFHNWESKFNVMSVLWAYVNLWPELSYLFYMPRGEWRSNLVTNSSPLIIFSNVHCVIEVTIQAEVLTKIKQVYLWF